MSEQGARLFARYAYPPNELGYCGPPDASALLRADAAAEAAGRPEAGATPGPGGAPGRGGAPGPGGAFARGGAPGPAGTSGPGGATATAASCGATSGTAGTASSTGTAGPTSPAGTARATGTPETTRTSAIERHARRFEGAWSYLEFLAEAAGLADPLDVRVVEAYWLGNELLERVDPAALLDRLLDRFRGQLGGTWRQAGRWALPHHSFQVFEVYPWAGLLRGGGNPTALSVLDQCRIRTGTVLRVDGETATVRSRPLRLDGAAVVAGPPRRETVRWSTGGRSLIGAPRAGDRVALHWDWVCDVLTEEQCARVESLEARVRDRLAGAAPRDALGAGTPGRAPLPGVPQSAAP